MPIEFDVAVIGAGPSGSVASALPNKQSFKVCVLENNISHSLSSAKACCRIGGRFEGRIRTNAFQTAKPENRTGRLKLHPHHSIF